ncbi:hypothetical protein Tco_1417794 [Tanacetum coccineum]
MKASSFNMKKMKSGMKAATSHVTNQNLKQTRIGLHVVETTSQFLVTTSKCSRDDVKTFIDEVAFDLLRDALSAIFGLSELKGINTVMSDSDESGITYTAVSSPYEDLSDIGSPRADDHELLELPYMPEDPYVEAALQAPPSPDYVPGPEEPEHAPPSPDYVPGAEHVDDEIVAEDQPYAEDASPIAQSPDYVPESDPEADPEEDDDEDPEEDPIDYPADGGDDGDDEMDIEEDEDDDMDIEADEEDEDDEMDVEIDEEAEEEHLAPAYPVVVALPATAPSAEETEPFETDESAATPPPHPAYRMTARITIPEPLPVPASPLSPWSSSPPQIPFPLSPPSPAPTSIPLTIITTDSHRRADRVNLHLDGLGLALGPGYEVGESSAAAAARPVEVLGQITDLLPLWIGRLRDPERGQGQLLAGRVNMLFRDRRTHAHTRQLMETEAGMSREAWRRAMDSSDLAHGGVISLRTTVHAQMAEIAERREEMRELRAADRTRQQQIIQTLTAVQTLQRETIPLQGLVTTLQGQVTALQGQVMTLQGQVTVLQGQQGPAGGPAQPELPEDTGSSS